MARINLMEIFICSLLPRYSCDKVGTQRALARRASAARAILLANAASLYSSQQAAQAVPSQFVAKSGERDGSGASSRTPTLLIFDEKFAISSPSPNSPSKTRDCTGKSNGRLRVQKFDEKFAKFPPRWPKGLFICSCACLDELASTSAFPTRAPTVDQQPTNGSLGEYLYQLRTSGPGKGTPIESVFWKFV